MTNLDWMLRMLAGAAVATLLAGCLKDAPTVLQADVVALAEVNPDLNGRPSPVALRFYELKRPDGFRAASFFELYGHESQALGADLIGWGELRLVPGDEQTLQVTLDPETRHIGFLAAFRDIELADWRVLLPVRPSETNAATLSLGGRALSVSETR